MPNDPDHEEARFKEERAMEIKKKKMRAHPNWDKSDDLSEVPVFHIE